MIPGYPDTAELWPAMQARLNTVALAAVLRGPSRVYVEGAQAPAGLENDRDWGSVAIVPTRSLWNPPARPGESRGVGFLLRAEFNNLVAPGYTPDVSIGAAHRVIMKRIQGWVPAPVNGAGVEQTPADFRHIRPATDVQIASYAQPRALWDDDRGMWYSSAEYRVSIIDKW
jgi:hypothetical protein